MITPNTVRIENTHEATWGPDGWTLEELDRVVLHYDGHSFAMYPEIDGTRYGLGLGSLWLAEKGDRRHAATVPKGTLWVGWHGENLLYAGRCMGTWTDTPETLPVCTEHIPFPVGDGWGVGIGNVVAVVEDDTIHFRGPPGTLFIPSAPLYNRPMTQPTICPAGPTLDFLGWIAIPTADGVIAQQSCPTKRGRWARYGACDGELIELREGRGAYMRKDGIGKRFITLGRFCGAGGCQHKRHNR